MLLGWMTAILRIRPNRAVRRQLAPGWARPRLSLSSVARKAGAGDEEVVASLPRSAPHGFQPGFLRGHQSRRLFIAGGRRLGAGELPGPGTRLGASGTAHDPEPTSNLTASQHECRDAASR